ncbi:MAG: beta-glucosidase [Halobellus sp.]|uniref:beta-glucosidase n=1 Tax=Halobellus sp. TaxID=1979212 RepID=UPI0035D524C2
MNSEKSVPALVDSLSRAEKVRLVHGATDPEGEATGFVPGVDRVGIPPLRLVDGPLGIRTNTRTATAFPASIALAASFDTALAEAFGAALGREATAHGQDVVLAPGTNLLRVPRGGRNFEYFSEDPVLASDVAAAVVDGIQSVGVIATVKHFVANNQETDRCAVSAAVEERTLRELYLRPFRAAVDAGVGSVMAAYNGVNGTPMVEHRRLLTEVLKREWGFSGFVMSDWHAIDQTVESATAGVDLEMPGVSASEAFDEGLPESFDLPEGFPDITSAGSFGDPLAAAVDAGTVEEARLDDMVRRILTQMDRFDLLDGGDDRGQHGRDVQGGQDGTVTHDDLAERLAVRGTVLLENDGVLPVTDEAPLAVIGPNVTVAKLGGGGSSETTPRQQTSPAEGITARATGEVSIAHGIDPIEEVSLFDDLPFGGDDDGSVTDDGTRENATEREADTHPDPTPRLEHAREAASKADVAVVFVQDVTTEGSDRGDLTLPGEQDALVSVVADAADEAVVVVNSGGPVAMPWRESVDAIVEAWYPGQADGDAIAAVLFGDVDPSGRLPVSFAAADQFPTADRRRFPGTDGEARYDEGLLIGYRHFDAVDTTPSYPFGHGESYAAFRYGQASTVDEASVAVTVENVSDRRGREVVQAYVTPPAHVAAERPPRELAGFETVELAGGESRRVRIPLDELAVGRYDPHDGWCVDAGEYVVEIGRSAGDVRTQTTIERGDKSI